MPSTDKSTLRLWSLMGVSFLGIALVIFSMVSLLRTWNMEPIETENPPAPIMKGPASPTAPTRPPLPPQAREEIERQHAERPAPKAAMENAPQPIPGKRSTSQRKPTFAQEKIRDDVREETVRQLKKQLEENPNPETETMLRHAEQGLIPQ